MSDSDIWNEGKELFLSSYNISDKDNLLDIFSYKSIFPFGLLKHKIILQCSSNSLIPTFKYSSLRPMNNEYFIGNMMLSFQTPNIFGEGIGSFCDNLGYAIVEHVNIKIGNAPFTFSGNYLYQQIMTLPSANKILEDAGHNESCRSVSTTTDSSQLLKSKQVIKVLLLLPFGINFPKNLIPLAANDEIKVEVSMRHISSVINCSKESKFELDNYSNYKLHIELYSKRLGNRILYTPILDLPETIISQDSIIKVKSTRNIQINQQCDLNGMEYVTLFSNWKDESDIVNKFKDYITDNILYVYQQDIPMSEIAKDFPSTAVLQEVINGEVILQNSKNTQRRIIRISIRNLPKDYKLYYHTNLLVINKFYKTNPRDEDSKDEIKEKIVTIDNVWQDGLNISEKIMSIQGIFDSTFNKILCLKVEHVLKSQYASIPVSVFRKLGEDNRKFGSTNYRIWCYFTNGPNMFKPKILDNFIIYQSKDSVLNKDSDLVLVNNEVSDNLQLIENQSLMNTNINFNFMQNNSRFNFRNLNNIYLWIEIAHKKLEILKCELYKISKDVVEFREAKHEEYGFESILPYKYIITYYQSYIVNHMTSKNGDTSLVTSNLLLC